VPEFDELAVAPPPPPPIVSIVLVFDQSPGTVQLVPETIKIWVMVEPK
jgi:hypothetical protein